MKVEEAVKLKRGDKVWVAHKDFNGPGVVAQSGCYGEVHTNINGVEYVWVLVKIPGLLHSSVYPSHCITKEK